MTIRTLLSLALSLALALGGWSVASAQIGSFGTIAPRVSYTVILNASGGMNDGTASEVEVRFRNAAGSLSAPFRFTRGVAAGASVSQSVTLAPLGDVVEAVVAIAGPDGARVSVELIGPDGRGETFGPARYVHDGSIVLSNSGLAGDYGDCMHHCMGDSGTFISCHSICRELVLPTRRD